MKNLKIYAIYSLVLLTLFAFEVWLFGYVHPLAAISTGQGSHGVPP